MIRNWQPVHLSFKAWTSRSSKVCFAISTWALLCQDSWGFRVSQCAPLVSGKSSPKRKELLACNFFCAVSLKDTVANETFFYSDLCKIEPSHHCTLQNLSDDRKKWGQNVLAYNRSIHRANTHLKWVCAQSTSLHVYARSCSTQRKQFSCLDGCACPRSYTLLSFLKTISAWDPLPWSWHF